MASPDGPALVLPVRAATNRTMAAARAGSMLVRARVWKSDDRRPELAGSYPQLEFCNSRPGRSLRRISLWIRIVHGPRRTMLVWTALKSPCVRRWSVNCRTTAKRRSRGSGFRPGAASDRSNTPIGTFRDANRCPRSNHTSAGPATFPGMAHLQRGGPWRSGSRRPACAPS